MIMCYPKPLSIQNTCKASALEYMLFIEQDEITLETREWHPATVAAAMGTFEDIKEELEYMLNLASGSGIEERRENNTETVDEELERSIKECDSIIEKCKEWQSVHAA